MALLRPCNTSAGFLATQDRNRRVRMPDLKAALVAHAYTVVVDAHIILVVRKGIESSIYDTGKVLLKTTDKATAESAYEELAPFLAAHWD